MQLLCILFFFLCSWWYYATKFFHQICCCNYCLFILAEAGYIAVGGEEFCGVGHSDGSGCRYLVSPTAIMLHGWANVPCINGMGRPSGFVLWIYVDQDFGAWGAQWCVVVVKGSLKCFVCQLLGV